jgi:hypothetical protein
MGHCPAHRGLEREIAAIDHVAQGDCREEAQDLAAERRPQLVGDAFLAIDAAIDGIALAAGHLKRFVDRLDDLGNPDVVGLAGQGVAAPRPAGALDQICTPEFSEKLLQILLADPLAVGDIAQRHRSTSGIQGNIGHRHHGVAALGRQLHG